MPEDKVYTGMEDTCNLLAFGYDKIFSARRNMAKPGQERGVSSEYSAEVYEQVSGELQEILDKLSQVCAKLRKLQPKI